MASKITNIKRTNFCDLLEKEIKKYKIIYIGTHTGWGKTTAVMQWLEKYEKNYTLFSAFDEDFLDKLSKHESTSNEIIVLDDIQNITGIKDQEDIIRYIVGSNACFVLTSLAEKLSFLKSFEITGQLLSLSEKQLALSTKEISELLTLNGIEHNARTVDSIMKVTKGWAVSVLLLIKRLKNKEALSDKLYDQVRHELFSFLDFKLFNRWDSKLQTFFMAMSNFESFTVKMASMISGKSDIINTINYIMQTSSFLHFTPPDIYTFQPFMKLYLLKKQNERCSPEQIARIFQNAGLYYELANNLTFAMECYYHTGDTKKVSELLMENSTRHTDNSQYYDFEKYYIWLPRETILNSPVLMTGMAMLHSLCCRPEESEKWVSELERFKDCIDKSDKRYKVAKEQLAFLILSLPHRGSKDMLDRIRNTIELSISGGFCLQQLSITDNMPSLLNGGLDFCEWLHEDKKIYSLLKKPFELALGECAIGFFDVALGESFFEKNSDGNYTDALTKINSGLSNAQAKGTAQMIFAASGIMARLFTAQGSMDTAVDIIENVRAKMANDKCGYLLPNIDAFCARQQLKLGNLLNVDLWYNEKAPNENKHFHILSRYRYMTKIRCYIQKEKYLEALSLIDKMRSYFINYGRTYNEIENQILFAVTLFRKNDLRWQEELNHVLIKCEKYGLIRIVSDEGMSVYPLFNKLNYTCSDDFFKLVFTAVKLQSRLYPDYLVPTTKSLEDLTENEMQVLELLVRGFKNDEIAGLMDLSINTIKFHLKKIYAKLQVTSKAQAIIVATNQNLI